MVLESVIVDVLNKFLGEYVESVDKSQLKVAFGMYAYKILMTLIHTVECAGLNEVKYRF